MSNTTRMGMTPARNRITRGLAAAILLAFLSPMTLSLAGCTVLGLIAAVATKPKPRVIPAGDALHLEPGVMLQLVLADGSTVSGRFLGRTLLAPEAYAPRFARRPALRPIALGETLRVTLADAHTLRGTFRGYAVRSLVLRDMEDTRDVRILFDSTREVRLPAGGLVAVDSLRAADERGELPSLEALAIEPADRPRAISARPGIRDVPGPLASRIESALKVAYEDIRGTTVRTTQGLRSGYIVLGLVVDVLVVVIVAAAAASSMGGCTVGDISMAQAGPPAQWTERPFDTRLARFVDEWDRAPDVAAIPGDAATVTAASGDSSTGVPIRGTSSVNP